MEKYNTKIKIIILIGLLQSHYFIIEMQHLLQLEMMKYIEQVSKYGGHG